MNDTKKYLGARIQEIRRQKSLTQAELAEMLDIDAKHMSKIECGRCYPSFELLDKIADKLGIPVGDLFIVEHLHNREELVTQLAQKLKELPNEKFWMLYKILKEII